MRNVLDDLTRWHDHGIAAAVGRVVAVDGSSPRQPGAALAVDASGVIIGSVSGGCVEAAVVQAAQASILDGVRGVHSFGYSDDDAFGVGLTCGGTVHVYVEPFDWPEIAAELHDSLNGGSPVALATVVQGRFVGAKALVRADGTMAGSVGGPELTRAVRRDALGELAAGRTAMRRYGCSGQAQHDDVAVFVESFVAPPRMIILGAADFTAALVNTAKLLGFHVTVCDARAAFATQARFPAADEVLVERPQRLLARIGPTLGPPDAVCVLTHDHRFDVPAIAEALRTNVGYLGAMGSRRTNAERAGRLRADGVTKEALARLHGPIGLDLGATTPEETAISICAEVIAARTGRNEIRPLRSGEGPIHS